MIKSLPIFIVIGLFVLPSGRALKCYQCSSDLEGDCVEPKEEKLLECQITPSTSTTTTTQPPPDSSSTSTATTTQPPPASSSASPDTPTETTPESSNGNDAGGEGSGVEGESSGAGIEGGEIVYGGEGVVVVSGDEDDVVEGANGGSTKNEKKGRVSRAILQRISSNQVYADDQPKMVCVKRSTNTTVTRGCAHDTEDCSGDNCHKCDSDACNSATSVAVYTSMMFGLLAFVFMTR